MLILQTKDLFFIPTIKAAAVAHAQPFLVVASCDAARLEQVDASTVRVFIVDLSGVGLAEIETTAEALRARFPQARLIAYGPHVHAAKLEQAETGGFDQVLSRGQMSSQVGRLVPQWIDEA